MCPFHNEWTPSFTVRDDRHFIYCFGCGAHGDMIDFIRRADGLGFRAAVAKLAGELAAGYRPPTTARLGVRRWSVRIRNIMGAEPRFRHAWVPESAIYDKRLGEAFRVFCCLLAFADKNGHCFVKVKTIAALLGKARSTVSEHLSTLERLGYIVREAQFRDEAGKGKIATGSHATDCQTFSPMSDQPTWGARPLRKASSNPPQRVNGRF